MADHSEKLLHYRRYLETKLHNAVTTVASFRDTLEKDPAYAFEWGDGALQSAVSMNILKRLLGQVEIYCNMILLSKSAMDDEEKSKVAEYANRLGGEITDEAFLQKVAAWFKNQLIDSVQGGTSSSEMTNMVYRAKTKFYASVIEDFGYDWDI